MANSSNLLLIHLLISTLILSSFKSSASSSVDEFNWISGVGGCKGSIAECMESGEMEMESESTRRILATSNYISYGALQANNAPCSQRGASYYNCKSGGQANPYQRGCSTITRCSR
ncbi:rapid alkalinization factor-like [Bidens hawaiensis]|uniref:rapid alkalinization factor-like n=1 Tax=Bidens hawaiensis TaxID=980011 RepID=UPI0040493123